MIDRNNLRLMSELGKNGRASYIQLAKSIGLSTATVIKRVQSLLENKTITIRAIPNPYKMGYVANGFIGMNVSMKSVDGVCARLSNNFSVSTVLTTFGRFNLLAIVQFAAWDKLVNFISAELPTMGSIYEIETFFIKDIKKRFYGIFGDRAHEQSPAKIDKLDQKLIEELSNNGRCKATVLANKLGITLSAVSRRLSHLLNENVIQIQAIPDPTKLGYKANEWILMRADFNKIDDICADLYRYNEVVTLMTLANGYDLVLSVIAKDTETLYEFNKNKIANIPGIISVETLVFGLVLKRYYGYLMDFTPA